MSLAIAPLFASGVSAGFPSPADDHIDKSLDLNEYIVKRPVSTFFVRVDGFSMINAGIYHGDILVVDRALEAYDQSIVVAILDGEFTVKRFHKVKNSVTLIPESPKYRPIHIREGMDFEVWGVVTYVIHKAK